MSAGAPGEMLIADTLLVRSSIGTVFLRMTDGSTSGLIELSPEEALCTARVLKDAAREAMTAEGAFGHRG